MTLYVAPIVEGETEENCIKVLLSRVWNQLLNFGEREPLAILEPNPENRSALVGAKNPALERRIEQSFRKLQSRIRLPSDRGFILLLLDADEDCPANLAPELLQRARSIRGDADICCVLPKRELENWFKAAASSLAGLNGLPKDVTVPTDPEIGSGDTWLTREMQKLNPKRKYTKPADAVTFAKAIDLQTCRKRSPSFDKLCRELEARILLPYPTEEKSSEENPK